MKYVLVFNYDYNGYKQHDIFGVFDSVPKNSLISNRVCTVIQTEQVFDTKFTAAVLIPREPAKWVRGEPEDINYDVINAETELRPILHDGTDYDNDYFYSQAVEAYYTFVENLEAKQAYQQSQMKMSIRNAILSNITYGQQLISDFVAECTLDGIIQAGKSKDVRIALQDTISALAIGALDSAIAEIKAIPAQSKDEVFITNTRLLPYLNMLEERLGAELTLSLN